MTTDVLSADARAMRVRFADATAGARKRYATTRCRVAGRHYPGWLPLLALVACAAMARGQEADEELVVVRRAQPEAAAPAVVQPVVPVAVILDADALAQQAGNRSVVQPAIASDTDVTVPAGRTALQAVQDVIAQLPGHIANYDLIGSNAIARLESTPAAFANPDKPIDWHTALYELLKPHSLDFIEDGRVVRIGLQEAIAARRLLQAEENLKRNHTRVVVDFSGGTPLYTAMRFLQKEVGINMNFDYMEPGDRGLMAAQPLSQTGDAAAAAVQAPPQGKLTTYSTPVGQSVEWRVVLEQILDPFDHGFDESGGVVRPMPKAKLASRQSAVLNAQPLSLRVVRIYHAEPKVIVERLNESKWIFKHASASAQIASPDTSFSKPFTGSGMSASASGGSGGSMVGAEVPTGVSYGQMNRPRTPPAVVVWDVAENLPVIEELISRLDVRERQVVIEARIFEIGDDAMKQLGVKWTQFGGSGGITSSWTVARGWKRHRKSDNEYISTTTHNSYSADVTGDAPPEYATATDQAGQFNSVEQFNTAVNTTTENPFFRYMYGYEAILNPLQLSFMWDAIQEVKDFRLVSQPVIVIGDHTEAQIRVGDIIPTYSVKSSTSSETTEGQALTEDVEWQMIQDGVTLWVLPEICPDGDSIRLSVHPQFVVVNTESPVVAETRRGVVGINYPIQIREVDTRVIVPSGNTLMLGGLVTSSKGNTQTKVPILGDIPWLGRLFRHDAARTGRSNLVILITPTILDDGRPETGYEMPAQPMIDELMRGLGKDLKDPVKERKEAEERKKAEKKSWRSRFSRDKATEPATDEASGSSTNAPTAE